MLPSIKTIESVLGQSLQHEGHTARELRQVLEACDGSHKSIDATLEQCNALLGGYGIESIEDAGWDHYYCSIGLLYVNMGDTYIGTVIYDTRAGRFLVSDWGSIVERQEKRFAGR